MSDKTSPQRVSDYSGLAYGRLGVLILVREKIDKSQDYNAYAFEVDPSRHIL